jgi:hypothetical protein
MEEQMLSSEEQQNVEITPYAKKAIEELARKFLCEDSIFKLTIFFKSNPTYTNREITITSRIAGETGTIRVVGGQCSVHLWSLDGKRLLCDYGDISKPVAMKFNSQRSYERKLACADK